MATRPMAQFRSEVARFAERCRPEWAARRQHRKLHCTFHFGPPDTSFLTQVPAGPRRRLARALRRQGGAAHLHDDARVDPSDRRWICASTNDKTTTDDDAAAPAS